MIKAKLIMSGESLIRTHDLIFLMDCMQDGPEIEKAREYCLILSGYEARTRYPTEGIRICSSEEAEEAYRMALEIPKLIGLHI